MDAHAIRIISFSLCSAPTGPHSKFRNKCGAWFLMRRHLEYSTQISSSTKQKIQMADCFMHIFAIHKTIYASTSSTRISVAQCAHAQQTSKECVSPPSTPSPETHRTHTKNAMLLIFAHMCCPFDIPSVLCCLCCILFFFSALGRLKKKTRASKREATQTLCSMRYLQMLWRVETMLEICSEFVPSCRFLNSHISTISWVNIFAGVSSVDAIVVLSQSTHLQIAVPIFYLPICLVFEWLRLKKLGGISRNAIMCMCVKHYRHQWTLIEKLMSLLIGRRCSNKTDRKDASNDRNMFVKILYIWSLHLVYASM